ncbi:Gfo/Idh/MocA family protein [Candidatus Entotheonella palauensis]|uniref:Gfo/Idh/MocA family protein n=1 Tax=Candidatus Entotheonella palauensis TaxID=93172 RepID=UPI000B7D4A78|nr:Gfo/Idh/MocA family oxidoreductase [Candidatus Entotheonella palauensis]
MGRVIRWGMLGTGRIAQLVARDFRLVPDAELLAVASRELTRSQAFARDHGIAKAYGSYEDLLQDRDIDVVYIATPHMRHHDDALASIHADKAVLCEKSFTLNAREAKAVIHAARSRGVFCMEAMWMRFIPLMREVKTRVEQGEIGEITHLKAAFGYPGRFDPNHRSFNPHLGGGSLLDRGIYPISLAFYLLGRPASIDSQANIGPSGVDMTSDYHFHYDSGAEAVLGSSCRVYRAAEATIRGTAGEIHIHAPFLRPHRITVRPRGRAGGKSRGFSRTRVYQGVKRKLDRGLSALGGSGDWFQRFPGHGYQFELEAVTHCLQRGELEHETMPLSETLAIMEVMDKLRQQWGLVYPSEQS